MLVEVVMMRRLPHLLLLAGQCALLVSAIYISFLWRPTECLRSDWGSFWASGRALLGGENPFAATRESPVVVQPGAGGQPRSGPLLNLASPILLPLFALAARADPCAGLTVVFWLSLALYAASVGLLARRYPSRLTPGLLLWVCAWAPLWSSLFNGQIYALLVLATVASWLALADGRYVTAGLCLGLLVAVKPNFAVWPLALLVGGYLFPALLAGLTAAVLYGLALVAYGPATFLAWLAALRSAWWLGLVGNMSPMAIMQRLGFGWLQAPFAALCVAALAVYVYRRKPPLLDLCALALVVSVLAFPLGWQTYALFWLPIFFSRSWSWPKPALRRRGGSFWLLVAAAVLVIPEAVVFGLSEVPGWYFVAGLIYPLAGLLVLMSLLAGQAMPATVPSVAAAGDLS
jgi:alpha-1,2-mannosyltransferase